MVDTRKFASHTGGADYGGDADSDAVEDAEDNYAYGEVAQKGGGCAGCATSGQSSGSWLLLILGALLAVRRRRSEEEPTR